MLWPAQRNLTDQTQDRQGGAWRGHEAIWAAVQLKVSLSSPGAWAATSPGWLGMWRWVLCVLPPYPPEPCTSGLGCTGTHTNRDQPQLLTRSALPVSCRAWNRTQATDTPPSAAWPSETTPCSISASAHTTLPPTQEGRPQQLMWKARFP